MPDKALVFPNGSFWLPAEPAVFVGTPPESSQKPDPSCLTGSTRYCAKTFLFLIALASWFISGERVKQQLWPVLLRRTKFSMLQIQCVSSSWSCIVAKNSCFENSSPCISLVMFDSSFYPWMKRILLLFYYAHVSKAESASDPSWLDLIPSQYSEGTWQQR